jgi:hypothetical protein
MVVRIFEMIGRVFLSRRSSTACSGFLLQPEKS